MIIETFTLKGLPSNSLIRHFVCCPVGLLRSKSHMFGDRGQGNTPHAGYLYISLNAKHRLIIQ